MSNPHIATLQQQLETMTKHGLEVLPKEVTEAFERHIGELQESGAAKGLTVGAKAPDFTLSNHAGDNVNLSEELAKGPVILTFYRGEWCPFCNLELRAYQRIMDDIRESGAQLLAISPLTPDRSLSMQSKNELSFHVLSDSAIAQRRPMRSNSSFRNRCSTYTARSALPWSSLTATNHGSFPCPRRM